MDDSKPLEYVVKFLLVGDSAVGKTSLLLRYTEDRFLATHLPTIGVDYKIKKMSFDDLALKIQIWDTAGQERFKVIATSYFKGTHGIILVYSCDNRESFEHITNWIRQADQSAPMNSRKILIGNKSDLDESKRVVTIEEGRSLAEKHNIPFFETSAKWNLNINEAFECLAKEVKDEIASELKSEANSPLTRKQRSISIHTSDVVPEERRRCC